MVQPLTTPYIHGDGWRLIFSHLSPYQRKRLGVVCKSLCSVFRSKVNALHILDSYSLEGRVDQFFGRFPLALKSISIESKTFLTIAHRSELQKITRLTLIQLPSKPQEQRTLEGALSRLTCLRSLEMRNKITFINLKMDYRGGFSGLCDLSNLSVENVVIRDCPHLTELRLPQAVSKLDVTNCLGLRTVTPLNHLQFLRAENTLHSFQSGGMQGNRINLFIVPPGNTLLDTEVFQSFQGRTYALEALTEEPLLRECLEQGANPNEMLNIAINKGFLQLAKDCLEKGADPNLPGNRTIPLHRAIETENAAMVALLLHYGAHPNKEFGMSWVREYTLDLAMKIKDLPTKLSVVRLLLEHGAYPSEAADMSGMYPLNLAVLSRSRQLLELLFRHRADPNRVWEVGITPFYFACRSYLSGKCDISVVQLFLQNGADVKKIDTRRLFLLAKAQGNKELEALLIRYGASPFRFTDLLSIAKEWVVAHKSLFLYATAGIAFTFLYIKIVKAVIKSLQKKD